MKDNNERYKKDRVRGDIEFGKYYLKYIKANADVDIKIIEEKIPQRTHKLPIKRLL